MKILYDHQMFDAQVYGGISRYFANLISGIGKYDRIETEASVLYTNNHYLKGKVKSHIGRLLAQSVFSKPRKLRAWNKNYSKMRISRGQFDIFHPTYFHPYFLKFLRKPFVLTVHDMIYELFPGYFQSTDLTAEYKRKLVTAANHIIAISETTKKDLMRLLDVPEEKITVVYHGYQSVDRTTDPLLNLPEKYLLFVGSRDNYKNFDTFAAAFALVKKSHPDLKAVCVGGGDFTQEEAALFSKLQITDSVMQININDRDLYWIYKKALAFVYPSLYEGFGLPILEAFDANCPVISSDISCFREVAGDASVYFDPQDAQVMANTIMETVDDPMLRKGLLLNGEKRLANFTMEKCLSGTLDVYRKVC